MNFEEMTNDERSDAVRTIAKGIYKVLHEKYIRDVEDLKKYQFDMDIIDNILIATILYVCRDNVETHNYEKYVEDVSNVLRKNLRIGKYKVDK